MEQNICLICNEVKENNGLIVCAGCDEQGFDNFHEGVRYALNYLNDLYDGVKETDLWAEYMAEKEGK